MGPRGITWPRLLVVLFLIVLAAAILLPVIGRIDGGGGSREKCHSNLHQIAIAMKLYRQDFGACPPDLHERPIPPGEHWYGPDGNLLQPRHPGYGLAALWPDYITSARVLQCPKDKERGCRSDGSAAKPPSYDGEDPAAGPGGNMVVRLNARDVPYGDSTLFAPGAGLKYARWWRIRHTGGGPKPDVGEKRQLVWANASDQTVITWCPYHRREPRSPEVRSDDQDLVVFLDGSVRALRSRDGSGHGADPEAW